MDPDQALARALRRRAPGALREAYERHGSRVQRLCLRLLGNRAEAEDAAQEVFLKLHERAVSFEGRARLSTWIHRLTVNHCLHRLEKTRLRATEALPREDALRAGGDDPPEAAGRRETGRRVEELLQRLTPEHRAVIVLRELEQQSYREIAAALAIPEGTVMSRLARAREHLARLLPDPNALPLPNTLANTHTNSARATRAASDTP